ncbi:hypothetical protein LEN26_007283 [Aphanomyces euteiches]|nr:hypothetical protein AeMF1_001056 [Aphanomyces euteiches]KAH9132870.1 hypothetical protein LEN26_007283 [Aphanomyces euteiches]KAH9185738.1 hypothetical protein AeNC1_012286 [Aphanomyces euteiches]
MESEAPRRGGRQRDPVWENCIVDDNVVSCKRCEKIIHTYGYRHVERVRHHMEKNCLKRLRSQPITNCFPVALSHTSLAEFERRVASWVYKTGVSFNAISHPELAAALATLHPDLQVPSDHSLRNRLLDDAYASSIANIENSLKGTMCSLTTDAWTDVNGKAVVNYMAIRGSMTFFLESSYTGSISHTASFMAEDVERVINKYKSLTFTALITDNTSANRSMWKTLRPKYPRMFFHGCASHALHLLAQDVVQAIAWLRQLVDGCKRLPTRQEGTSFGFAGSHTLGNNTALSGHGLGIGRNNLWACYARGFLVDSSKEKKSERRFLHDMVAEKSFVPSLTKGSELLELFTKSIRICERSETSPSDVYSMFLVFDDQVMSLDVSSNDKTALKRAVKRRFDFIVSDVHGVAYLLDPRYYGVGMNPVSHDAAKDYIYNWHGQDLEAAVVTELASYNEYVGRMGSIDPRSLRLLAEGTMSPHQFWVMNTRFPLLRDVAVTVFSCAVSSAASERNFSSFKFIHSRIRNRLSESRVEKLVHLFYNGKYKDTEIDDLIHEVEADEGKSTDEEQAGLEIDV